MEDVRDCCSQLKNFKHKIYTKTQTDYKDCVHLNKKYEHFTICRNVSHNIHGFEVLI